ncbi:MAG TPA: CheR family methyltransferase, partial [Candidatus Acidoferrum sp.]|nr:CheR family methyltransferase [Candidatus Acidoferrum sp.]
TATYTPKDLEAVPAPLRTKYFGVSGGRHAFLPDLRRSVIFGRHDLLQDAPISRLDLLVCRNTLMYFNAEAQARVLSRFHFGLNDTGVLYLGRAEMLLTHPNIFTPIDLKHRVFAKTAKIQLRDRMLVLAHAGDVEAADHPVRHERLSELVFDSGSAAQVVVDDEGRLALANGRARALFGLVPKDLGRPLQDLELSYRPADLRTLIDRAYAERRTVTLSRVERRVENSDAQYFDIQATSIYDNGVACLGTTITFEDVTARQRLEMGLQRTTQELETSNEELQSAHEELETTNEELQSTNEELETTNEELQSSNEELETMNEELQSTNEELQTLNTELHDRSDALDTTNAFLQSILASMRRALVVVDRQMTVLEWNRQAEDLWGLRAEEVRGRPLLSLDIGLPVEQLPIAALLAGMADSEELTLPATNRRGRAILCNIVMTPFLASSGDRGGTVLTMEEQGVGQEGGGESAKAERGET